VMYACRKIDNLMSDNPRLRGRVKNITEQL
jgi:chromosomal replication initiation ATPase DnaA